MAARRVAFDGEPLVAAIQATFRRRGTPLPEAEMVGLSDVVEELRRFLQKPFAPPVQAIRSLYVGTQVAHGPDPGPTLTEPVLTGRPRCVCLSTCVFEVTLCDLKPRRHLQMPICAR